MSKSHAEAQGSYHERIMIKSLGVLQGETGLFHLLVLVLCRSWCRFMVCLCQSRSINSHFMITDSDQGAPWPLRPLCLFSVDPFGNPFMAVFVCYLLKNWWYSVNRTFCFPFLLHCAVAHTLFSIIVWPVNVSVSICRGFKIAVSLNNESYLVSVSLSNK